MGFLRRFRRRRVLARRALQPALWRDAVGNLQVLAGLTAAELARLEDWVVLFLAEKQLSAAGGLTLTDSMRLQIAAQACLPILNLDLDDYGDWVEIIVYPDEFAPVHEYMDDAGVVHTSRHPLAGEAWPGGPVILAWADVATSGHGLGTNVVIHEFAHKLDMRNGPADGYPPLHADMSRDRWTSTFRAAYEDFCRRVEAGMPQLFDPYGAEHPAEFFAVMSEAFFEVPGRLQAVYGDVYEQLRALYRQDPVCRRARIEYT